MNKITKNILLGLLLGIAVSVFGAVLYVMFMFNEQNLNQAFRKLFYSGLITKVIALGTLPNALVFHFLVKQNKIYIARGVLMAVVVLALVFAVLKFI